jgi:cytosine/adenosine deaminase-related metal-dependent hydrolase
MDSSQQYSLRHATLITPSEIKPCTDLMVRDGQIAGLLEAPPTQSSQVQSVEYIDLRGYLIFPALINAHDHLNGTWWPRVGSSRPYTNVYQWLDELHTSSVRSDRQRNSVDDIYLLGVYRNLISGVATIADHFWRINGPEFYTRFPIDVLYRYGRTWTPREPTAWGDDITTEYSRAVRANQPYVIHLAEGLDAETAEEMDVLYAAKALGRNTMIVHGIGLRPGDIKAVSAAGASVCWCPASNLYLYGQTADVRTLSEAGVNVTLGTDSTLSGSLDLLDELRTAKRVLVRSENASPLAGLSIEQWLVESVTTRAAHALLRQHRSGRIAAGYDADLLVLADTGKDPYEALIQARPTDIALLLKAGVPVYGDQVFHRLFERHTPQFAAMTLCRSAETDTAHNTTPKLVAGDPQSLLDRMSATIGQPVHFPFLPLAPADKESCECPES